MVWQDEAELKDHGEGLPLPAWVKPRTSTTRVGEAASTCPYWQYLSVRECTISGSSPHGKLPSFLKGVEPPRRVDADGAVPRARRGLSCFS